MGRDSNGISNNQSSQNGISHTEKLSDDAREQSVLREWINDQWHWFVIEIKGFTQFIIIAVLFLIALSAVTFVIVENNENASLSFWKWSEGSWQLIATGFAGLGLFLIAYVTYNSQRKAIRASNDSQVRNRLDRANQLLIQNTYLLALLTREPCPVTRCSRSVHFTNPCTHFMDVLVSLADSAYINCNRHNSLDKALFERSSDWLASIICELPFAAKYWETMVANDEPLKRPLFDRKFIKYVNCRIDEIAGEEGFPFKTYAVPNTHNHDPDLPQQFIGWQVGQILVDS